MTATCLGHSPDTLADDLGDDSSAQFRVCPNMVVVVTLNSPLPYASFEHRSKEGAGSWPKRKPRQSSRDPRAPTAVFCFLGFVAAQGLDQVAGTASPTSLSATLAET